ncbi:acetate--CoA ligase family protein [Candidatus Lokiarchaeum ossiferum]|uniref:acetate--CoA ligase family protein n=1 Tax=Candidatus Lokiarchaeum ossiferum TaxID=2951803 RepID=UPI00352BFE75
MTKLFFYPKTIAVIGATEDPSKFGNAVTTNLLDNPNLEAELFPISRSNDKIYGLQAYKSLLDVPKDIDLAIVLVPAKVVPFIVDQCIQKPVKRIIVVTAGFGEINEEGKQIEQEMARKCRAAGIRMIGPNCVGIQNVDIGMNASFIQSPIKGNISMVSQSGSFGCAMIDGMRWNNLGLSKFANIGNGVDLTFDEILHYFKEDENSKVLSVYTEAVKNGKSFYQELKAITPVKPVVVLKGGRTQAGMAAAGSHTGSLASNYTVLKAAVDQSGAVMCEKMEDYVTALKTFSLLPLPKGNRIAVLTNSGGAGVLYSDNAEEQGLKLAPFSDSLIEKLKPYLIDLVQKVNPLDMIAGANEDTYYQVTKVMLEDPEIDIVVPCGVYPPFLGMKFENNFSGMIKAWNETGRKKPMLPLLVFGSGYEGVVDLAIKENVAFFSTPHEAAYATKILIDRMNFLLR